MQEKHVFEESYIVRDNDQIIHGFMDLVIYKNNEIIIVDFKTDTVRSKQELIDLYHVQLETYKHAMSLIHEAKISCYLYSFCLNESIWLDKI